MKGDAQPGYAPPAGRAELGTEGLRRCADGVRKHRLGIELGLASGGCAGLALYGDIGSDPCRRGGQSPEIHIWNSKNHTKTSITIDTVGLGMR